VPEIVFVAIKVGFLALLWLFVLAAVRAVRADLFGPSRRARRRSAPRPAPPPPPPARPRTGRRNRPPQRLVVTEGPLRGTTVPLGDLQVTIGRADDSTIVLTDEFASSRHARLWPHDGQWLVEDLGSTNGTYLDRSRVVQPTPVPVGMPVRIGRTVLELRR
jgi:hypothetical protein